MSEPTYNGQRLNQGELTPHTVESEGFAVLQCGGTSVRLSYTTLHALCGWLHMGARGDSRVGFSAPIIRAVEAVTGEAAVGNMPENLRADEFDLYDKHL